MRAISLTMAATMSSIKLFKYQLVSRASLIMAVTVTTVLPGVRRFNLQVKEHGKEFIKARYIVYGLLVPVIDV